MSNVLTKAQRERKEALHVAMALGAIVLALLVKFALSFDERMRVSDAYRATLKERKCVVGTLEGDAAKTYVCGHPGVGQSVTAEALYAHARVQVAAKNAKVAPRH